MNCAKRGLFITFDGVEGSGKTTQARMLYEHFREKGLNAVLTRDPGGTGISEKIREIILDVDNAEMHPVTEALLYASARAQLVSQVILPAVSASSIVICDRFVDSSAAYQSYARGLELADILGINAFAARGLSPDITFLLDIAPEAGFSRKSAQTPDRLEAEVITFHAAVRRGYLLIAEGAPERVKIINAAENPETIHKQIIHHTAGLPVVSEHK